MIDIESAQGATEEPVEHTGGSSFIWKTGVYPVTITQAYCIVAKSGAQAFHFRFENAAGKMYKEDVYFTSKAGAITYPDKKDPNKSHYLPGFITATNIIACVSPENFRTFMQGPSNGATLNARYEAFFKAACATCTSGTVPKWDWGKRKDIDTEVDDVMTGIIGKQINLALTQTLVNKRAKDNSGAYVDIADTRDENEIANIYTMDGFSVGELKTNAEEPAKMAAWIKNNSGKVRDKRTIESASEPSQSPATALDGSTNATTNTMFD